MEANSTDNSPATDAGSKEKIIKAALDEFVEFGVSGARVDRIAKRAQINKAMIYYYYHSKAELYRAVMENAFRQAVAKLHCRVKDSDDLRTVLKELSSMHTHLFTEIPGFREMVMRELAKADTDGFVRLKDSIEASQLRELARKRIEAGMATGEFRKLDGRQVMAAYISMSIGFFFLAPMIQKLMGIEDLKQFQEERVNVIPDIFLQGLKSR